MQFSHLLAITALILCAAAADAQVHLHGRVIEDVSEQPIAGATVLLQDARGRSLAQKVTDDSGEFSFLTGRSGPVRLLVERTGYKRTTTSTLEFDDYTMYRVEVRLDATAVLLAPLEVVARSRSAISPTLTGFEQRRVSGIGSFITRAEIERRNPSRVTDLLAVVPGMSIQRRIVFARVANCPAQIYIDGFHINRPVRPMPGRRGRSSTEMFPVDDVVQPRSIEGIEVYQGLSRVPAEFYTPEAACGVVAIWTRRGG